MPKRNYELTEGEWAIIRAVWDNEPCAAPTVQEELAGRKNWTYSTVKTMMDRMVTKKLLRTERIRNLILYRSAITRAEAQKGELMRAEGVDKWGSPYEIVCTDDDIVVLSLGPDKRKGTDDDIRFPATK